MRERPRTLIAQFEVADSARRGTRPAHRLQIAFRVNEALSARGREDDGKRQLLAQ